VIAMHRITQAELAQPLWGMKAGRLTFTRPRPVLHRPEG